MNSIIRKSNIVNPNFNLNDSSPTSLQKRQRLENLHAEIQEEQLSEFTKYYRREVKRETLINSQISQCDQQQCNSNNNNSINNNQLHSKQTIEISDFNEENHSRVSFEALSPLKRTSKSLVMNKCVYTSGFPQLSTCLSLQNNSEIKSPNICSSQKRVEFSPLNNGNSKQNHIESFRTAAETFQLIKMQSTFHNKQNKPQNQQFLEKCFGQFSASNRLSSFQTPLKSQKSTLAYQTTSSKQNFIKFDMSSQNRGSRLQEMDFITMLNSESQNTTKTNKSCILKVQRANSLTDFMKIKQSTNRLIDSKRETIFPDKKSDYSYQNNSQKSFNKDIRSQSQKFIAKEKDFSMNNPQNFSRHLKSLEQLHQSEKNRKKIRIFAEEMIKNFRSQDSDLLKKPLKIIIQQQQQDLDQSTKQKDLNSQSRKSSLQITEQIHSFKRIRNKSIASQDQTSKERKSIQIVSQTQLTQIPIISSKLKVSPPNSLSSITDNNHQEEKQNNPNQLANQTYEQLQKLYQLKVSRQKIVKILKYFLSGQSSLLSLLLDENKLNLNDEINVKMLEDLIVVHSNQSLEEKQLIEHELLYLCSKIQEYIIQQEMQQCEIYKKDILNGCQSLQNIANKINMRNKDHKITAYQTLENLSFMSNHMFNKQHSVVDQLVKSEIKYGQLQFVNQQNLSMNKQIENKLEKMVKARQKQIKMTNIFNAQKANDDDES